MSSVADDQSGGQFQFDLHFELVECPTCGAAMTSASCTTCERQVEHWRPSAGAAAARAAALGGLATQVHELNDSLSTLPAPSLPISEDSFRVVLAESTIFDSVLAINALGPELESMALNERRVIGGDLRRLCIRAVRLLQRLVDEATEVALFTTGGHGAELQRLTLMIAKRGGSTLVAYFEVLVAVLPADAHEAHQRLQESLEVPPEVDDYLELLDDVPGPDINRRLNTVLGTESQFTDSDGRLHLPALGQAFAGADSPWLAVGVAAARRFAPYFPSGLKHAQDPGALLLPAVLLALAPRPLTAERAVAATVTLFSGECSSRADRLQLLQERLVSDARTMVVSSRAQRRLERAEDGLSVEAEPTEQSIEDFLSGYRTLCEGPWRDLGWLVLRAIGADGSESKPMVGELAQRLLASEEPLAVQLGEVADVELRNAAAHDTWHWDPDAELVIGENAQEWLLDDVIETIERLQSAMAGCEAGLVAAAVDANLHATAASKAGDQTTRDRLSVAAQLVFGLSGATVVELRDDGHTVVVDESPGQLRTADLMPALVAWASSLGADGNFVVCSGSGSTIVSVPGSYLEAADPDLADLAALVPFAAAELGSEHPGEHPGRQLLASQLLLVVARACEELEHDVPLHERMDRVDRRLGYCESTARRWADPGLAATIDRIATCRKLARRTRAGNSRAGITFGKRFEALLSWSTANREDFIERAQR